MKEFLNKILKILHLKKDPGNKEISDWLKLATNHSKEMDTRHFDKLIDIPVLKKDGVLEKDFLDCYQVFCEGLIKNVEVLAKRVPVTAHTSYESISKIIFILDSGFAICGEITLMPKEYEAKFYILEDLYKEVSRLMEIKKKAAFDYLYGTRAMLAKASKEVEPKVETIN